MTLAFSFLSGVEERLDFCPLYCAGVVLDSAMSMTGGLPFAMLIVDDDEDDLIFLDDAFLQLGYDAEIKSLRCIRPFSLPDKY